MTKQVLIILATIALSLGRIFGLKDEAFQAAAHLFVGGLAGAWLVDRRSLYLYTFVALCVVEVLCFLIGIL